MSLCRNLQNHLGWEKVVEAELLLLLLATGYFTNCPVLRDTGNQGDGSAAEACQQMQWDQKASPFPPVISLDGIRGYHLKPINQIVVA